MTPVLVDTSAFFALWVPDDRHHERASLRFRRLLDERSRLIATDLIVAESHALILTRHRNGIARSAEFLAWLGSQNVCEIVFTGRNEYLAATEILRSHSSAGLSLCDAVSFAVMRRLHARRVFTYDRHFELSGAGIVADPEVPYAA